MHVNVCVCKYLSAQYTYMCLYIIQYKWCYRGTPVKHRLITEANYCYYRYSVANLPIIIIWQ